MARSKKPVRRPPTALGYIRISDEKQRRNFSLKTQSDDVHADADLRKLDLIQIFCDEAKSAKKGFSERPAWKQLMAYLKAHKGEIGYVIVSSVCRFARTQAQAAQVRELLLKEYNVLVISRNADVDQESDIACVTTPLFDSIAEYDNRQRASRTRAGMRTATKNGWLMGSKAPYGYHRRYSENHGRKLLVVDEPAAEHVKYLFDAFTNTCLSQVEIHRELTRRGFNRKRKHLSYMLRNPAYCGEIRSPEDPSVFYLAQHQPIISKADFAKAQEKLDASTSSCSSDEPLQNYTEDRAMKAMLFCSVCNKRYSFGYSTSHTGRRYPYYNCPNWCISLTPVLFDRALEQVLSRIEACIPEGVLSLFIRCYADYCTSQHEDLRHKLADVRAKTSELLSLQGKAWDMRLSGKMSEADFERYSSEKTSSIEALQQREAELTTLIDRQVDVAAHGSAFLSSISIQARSLRQSSMKSILNWMGIQKLIVNKDRTLRVVLRRDTTTILNLLPNEFSAQT